MKSFVKLQPAQFVDQVVDGVELFKLPYPLCFHLDGSNAYADFWQGNDQNVLGFQRDLGVQRVEVWWHALVEQFAKSGDPAVFEQAVGMYVVSADKSGDIGVATNRISSVEFFAAPEKEEEKS